MEMQRKKKCISKLGDPPLAGAIFIGFRKMLVWAVRATYIPLPKSSNSKVLYGEKWW